MRQKLGQHFLQNDAVAKKIAASLETAKDEVVVEIGPGHGELTEELLALHAQVTVIEKDPELAEHVRQRFGDRVKVIEGDVLKALPEIASDYKLQTTNYSLVGNLPYYLSGFLFRVIGELAHKPRRSIFMIQKEVAERLASKPPRMNRLAAAVQYWAEPKVLFNVGREDFSPPPEVDSAVISLDTLPRPEGGPAISEDERYYKIMHILFQQPRKTILNNLASGFPDLTKESLTSRLAGSGIDPSLRPQNLSVEDLVTLTNTLAPGSPIEHFMA